MKDNHEIIAQALFDSLYSRLQAEMEENPIQHTVSPEFERKMKKLIERQKKTYYPLICTTGRRAACIGAALLIAASTAISVKAVRDKIAEFFSKRYPSYDIVYVEYNSSADYPQTIEQEYTIDVPKGFKIIDGEYLKLSNYVEVHYTNGYEQISFHQHIFNDNFHSNIDNRELKKEYYTDENNITYLIYYGENTWTNVFFEKNGYIFYIQGTLEKEQIIDLCKNIRKK